MHCRLFMSRLWNEATNNALNDHMRGRPDHDCSNETPMTAYLLRMQLSWGGTHEPPSSQQTDRHQADEGQHTKRLTCSACVASARQAAVAAARNRSCEPPSTLKWHRSACLAMAGCSNFKPAQHHQCDMSLEPYRSQGT